MGEARRRRQRGAIIQSPKQAWMRKLLLRKPTGDGLEGMQAEFAFYNEGRKLGLLVFGKSETDHPLHLRIRWRVIEPEDPDVDFGDLSGWGLFKPPNEPLTDAEVAFMHTTAPALGYGEDEGTFSRE